MERRDCCCCIIMSKDRPMQLYALLESFEKFVIGIRPQHVFIILKYSNERFAKGYRKVKHRFRDYIFMKEKEFFYDIIGIVANPFFTYSMFCVDDALFYDYVNLAYILPVLNAEPQAIGFSLRLGLNVDYCYMNNSPQNLTNYRKIDEDFIKWVWTSQKFDFAYPLEVSSSIYKTSFLKTILQSVKFNNPNTMELQMDLKKKSFTNSHPLLLGYTKSKCFCNPLNLTQTEFMGNRHHNTDEFDIHHLLTRFLNGDKFVIDVPKIHSPHQIIKPQFVPRTSLK
jgi:hypothetical protein